VLPRVNMHTLLQCNPASRFSARHIMSGECDPRLQAGSQAAGISKAVLAISRGTGKAVPEDSNNNTSLGGLPRRTRSTSHSPAMEPRHQVRIWATVPSCCGRPLLWNNTQAPARDRAMRQC